jgi:hypothetical protein
MSETEKTKEQSPTPQPAPSPVELQAVPGGEVQPRPDRKIEAPEFHMCLGSDASREEVIKAASQRPKKQG